MRNLFLTIASLFLAGSLTSVPALAAVPQHVVAGFNLTENGGDLNYDASTDAAHPTEAQKRVLEAKALGANHIILNIRAKMIGGRSNEIIPVTPPNERSKEVQRIARLVKFIKSQGLTVGLRPIFFVVGPEDQFPFRETAADGSSKLWWHGNIQPEDPNRWFESYRVYLDQYILVAKIAQADEFTIGAELYSMTVGIEDQWKQYPYGFPGRWLDLLRYVRAKLPKARLMYDINFTDDSVSANGLQKAGGEIERWRYRLVDLAEPTNDPAQLVIWKDLVAFWNELDAIGIDMYRSLGDRNQVYSNDVTTLAKVLETRSDSYATQLDTILTEINATLATEKMAIFKEVGFRSVDEGFIDPFTYAGTGQYNEAHQAAGYRALFESFWKPNWPWFRGMVFWDLPINAQSHGVRDTGFSPLRKPLTEAEIKQYFSKIGR